MKAGFLFFFLIINFLFYLFFLFFFYFSFLGGGGGGGGGGGRVRFFPFYSIQSDSSPFCSILFYPIFLQSKMSINQVSNNKNCSKLQQMNETLDPVVRSSIIF